MEVLLDLFEKAKHEEDLEMHEKWGKEERCPEHYEIYSWIAKTKRRLTSEQVVQQSRGAALMYTVSIELSDPAENVNGRGNPQRSGFGCVRCRSQQSHRRDREMGQLFKRTR